MCGRTAEMSRKSNPVTTTKKKKKKKKKNGEKKSGWWGKKKKRVSMDSATYVSHLGTDLHTRESERYHVKPENSLSVCLSLSLSHTHTHTYIYIYISIYIYIYICMYEVYVVIVVVMDMVRRVQILDKGNSISHNTYMLGKGMNPILFSPVMDKK